jgi:hypothetical protein
MTSIEAGPYELTKQLKDFYEKITYCIMHDNSISKRVYNKYGNVMKQEIVPMPDISSALTKLEDYISQNKKNLYV